MIKEKLQIKAKANRKMSPEELRIYLQHKKQSNIERDRSKFKRRQNKPARFY